MASSFGGRPGPNVSQFLRDLNTLPATHEPTQEDAFSNDDDLAMFTTTQFFDFDLGQNTDFQPQPGKPDSVETKDVQSPAAAGEFANSEFMSADFNFGDFGANYASPTLPNFQDSLNGLQPIQPSPQGLYHAQGSYGPPGSRIGEKAKTDAAGASVAPPPAGRPMSFEEASRLAAEEDKRRRNTAASARFRIKKKQREQALEKSAKEMTEKVNSLENRISQLETENKWLKNLIMEKNEGSQDVAALWKDFSAKQEGERKAAAAESKAKKARSLSTSTEASSAPSEQSSSTTPSKREK